MVLPVPTGPCMYTLRDRRCCNAPGSGFAAAAATASTSPSFTGWSPAVGLATIACGAAPCCCRIRAAFSAASRAVYAATCCLSCRAALAELEVRFGQTQSLGPRRRSAEARVAANADERNCTTLCCKALSSRCPSATLQAKARCKGHCSALVAPLAVATANDLAPGCNLDANRATNLGREPCPRSAPASRPRPGMASALGARGAAPTRAG
mmetsp:Transcript_5091/g.15031  ORF Transcript_5091/g.15031 Transcript_5091/m.15031 type:complete len:210 (-) Transcript_5091:8-637(-)